MSGIDWHGWRPGLTARAALHIGRLPGRKSVCLYVEETPEGGGALIRTLAFFKDEAAAKQALDLIDRLTYMGGA